FGPVDRPYGRNAAGLIVGLATRRTPLYPEGMTRVAMFGDPTKALGTVAEATMLMHTKGILVMTPDSAMVLTGKQSLDYSGGVSAEDNFGIGGYDRVMGPNGQAQYWAPNLTAACELLFQHYEYAYVAPGERWARPAQTDDPADRDVRQFP